MKSGDFLSILLALLTSATNVLGQNKDEDNNRPLDLTWIERPWEYKYLFKIENLSSFEESRRDTPKKRKPKTPAVLYFFGGFPPTTVIKIPHLSAALIDSELAVLRVDIQKDQKVSTPNDWGIPLEAHLNGFEDIVLSPLEGIADDRMIEVGHFFMGHYGASDPRYSPAICQNSFGDNTSPTEISGRYVESNFDPISVGYFGCREWAAQLYDKNRPYIDVTSYEYEYDYEKPAIKKGPRKGFQPFKIPLTYDPRVHSLIGFSRFEDPPKPVIGNHRGQWICFNDCPDGAAPGLIDDIKVWTKKQGWPEPKPPRNVRAFKDKKVKPEEFID